MGICPYDPELRIINNKNVPTILLSKNWSPPSRDISVSFAHTASHSHSGRKFTICNRDICTTLASWKISWRLKHISRRHYSKDLPKASASMKIWMNNSKDHAWSYKMKNRAWGKRRRRWMRAWTPLTLFRITWNKTSLWSHKSTSYTSQTSIAKNTLNLFASSSNGLKFSKNIRMVASSDLCILHFAHIFIEFLWHNTMQ